jgi:hypothetical protein
MQRKAKSYKWVKNFMNCSLLYFDFSRDNFSYCRDGKYIMRYLGALISKGKINQIKWNKTQFSKMKYKATIHEELVGRLHKSLKQLNFYFEYIWISFTSL